MRAIVDDENPYWSSGRLITLSSGCRSTYFRSRAIRFYGPEAFDGELAARYSPNIIAGAGEWPSPENMSANRGIILPSTIASEAQANAGDVLDSPASPTCGRIHHPRGHRYRRQLCR